MTETKTDFFFEKENLKPAFYIEAYVSFKNIFTNFRSYFLHTSDYQEC